MLCHVAILLRPFHQAVFMALCGFLTIAPAEAADRLNARQLQQLFPGRFQAIVQGFVVVSITARSDGSLLGEAMGKADTGQWRIRSDQLCIRFSKWLKGRTTCSAVVKEAGWYRSNDVQFRAADVAALSAQPDNR